MEEANDRQKLLAASIELLKHYRQGDRRAFISQVERQEQRLPGGLDRAEQAVVQHLLALSDDEGLQTAGLEAVGITRSHQLLSKVIAHPRPPELRLALEPYLERRSQDVSWLLERVEVGITGINVNARFWTSLPPAAWLGSGYEPQPFRLQWRGLREIADDTGRIMRFATRAISPTLTRVSTEDFTGQRYSIMQRDWWSPGVAPEARAITLRGEVAIDVHRWVGEDAGGWESETIDLGPFQCTLQFPDNWHAGTFTAVSR